MGEAHLRCCPPPSRGPHLYNLSLLRQTPSPLAADLYFSSRLLLYTFIKSTFRDGNSVGALHKCLFQKQSCSTVCIFRLVFWFLLFPFFSFLFSFSFSLFPSFSFLSFSFFFLFFGLCCLYCAYFPEYLKKPDTRDCSLIYMMFH